MNEQLKTIREFIEGVHEGERLPYRDDALTALAQVEAMAEQEPVAWAVYWGLPPTRKNSVHFDMESAQAVAKQIKSATEVRPLYAAPVAQQPQGEVVVTWNRDLTRILAVTRQDREGRILKVIAEAPAQQPQADTAPSNCTECRNADSWGMPDQPVCRSCMAGSAWEPLNKSSVNHNKQPQAEAVPNAAVAAIKYVLEHPTDSPIEFLNCWMYGDFSALRNEWEDVPEAVFVGADPAIAQQKGAT